MNADETSYELARNLLLAHMEDRFSDVVRIAKEALDSDAVGVLMAMVWLGASAWTVIAEGRKEPLAGPLLATYEQMRQLGALEFPAPFGEG